MGQAVTDWAYRKTGSEGLLNVLAGATAVVDAVGEMLSDPSAGSPGGAVAKGVTFFRIGKAAETAEGLGAAAARAEAAGLPHGVSVLSRKPSSPASSASAAAVKDAFGVVQTGANPAHHTVVLPKPVTGPVADLFNRIFGRTP